MEVFKSLNKSSQKSNLVSGLKFIKYNSFNNELWILEYSSCDTHTHTHTYIYIYIYI